MKETERRKRFFQIALKLINEKGFKAMTMRDLAKKLDCDPSNIYNYVPSKKALLDQLLFEISNKFHDGMATIEASDQSPLHKVKAVIAMHVRLTTSYPYQVALLAAEWRNLEKTREQDFVAFRDTYEKKLAAIIQAGIERGEFSDTNADFMTKSILSAIRWMYSWYDPEDPAVSSEELERLMTNFVLNGIKR